MFSFSGIGQILKETKNRGRILSGKHQARYQVICSRGPSVPYDGKHGFDIYPVLVDGLESDKPKFESLLPGSLVWIDNGTMVTWSKKYNNDRFWNVILMVGINNMKIIGNTGVGPSFSEHLRLYKNSVRFNG